MNIIKLTKKAGWKNAEHIHPIDIENLERFAALVRAEREWVDLTDDEIEHVFVEYGCDQKPIPADFDITRAVIAAFKEKNK